MHSTRKSILRSCLGFNFCILCGSWRSPRPRGCSRAVCQILRSLSSGRHRHQNKSQSRQPVTSRIATTNINLECSFAQAL